MFIVSFQKATGIKEITYLAQLPERLKHNGKYNEYGIVSKSKDAYQFKTRELALWHAKRREHWVATVI